ncbi:MAG: magnesium transporter [Fimbriiglobus sp.]|jgi:magnesium transporter|nr:magnesium transporter [Fimbriiglobus sp.]
MASSLTPDQLQEPVTNHMRRDFVRLGHHFTVAQALGHLRREQPPGRIIYFYVTDADDRLVGVLPSRRLLLGADDQKLTELMVTKVIAIPHTATVLEACEFFTLHKLLAFPVLDADRRLVGLVDVDLYTSELTDLDRREGNDDLFQLIGVHLTDGRNGSPLTSFRQRFPWLVANIVGGVVAAFLTGMFEVELQKLVALALFIPVVLALAESVSIQSVSLTLQALHAGRPRWVELLPKLGRELLTGSMLGGACGLVVAVVALLWIGQGVVAGIVFGGIAAGVTAAALIGAGIPNVLRLMQRDPKVAAGPISLAATDMVTLLAYFGLARLLLSGS